MNENQDLTPPVRVDETTGTLSTKVPARVFILNALQFIGILAASLAIPSPETAAVLAMLPENITAHVGKITLALLAAKPFFNLLSDWADNGKLDGSFVVKALAFALIPAFIFGMVGCAGLNMTLSTPYGDISSQGEAVYIKPNLPSTIRINPEK